MKILMKVALVLALVGVGMLLEHVRAQSKASLADARIGHIGISVKDVDKVVKQYTDQLQATHTPVHEIAGPFPFPASSKADRNTVIRTSEIKLNALEVHLMQAKGGASPWRDHLDKYGEGSLEHISFLTKDMQGVTNALVALGGTIVVGRPDAGFVYVQMPDLPFFIELNRMN